MSTKNANVTPGKIFIPDVQGRILLTIEDLNRLGAPTVTIETTNGTAAEDLQANSVTTAKILDGAVATAKIADGAVTAAKLADLLADAIPAATVTVGASVAKTNPITVAVQMKDAQGNNLMEVCTVRWWLSDVSYAAAPAHIPPSATIPDQALVYTYGYYATNIAASTICHGITDSSGRLHLRFQHNAAALTRYFYVMIGNKLIQGSTALIWT